MSLHLAGDGPDVAQIRHIRANRECFSTHFFCFARRIGDFIRGSGNHRDVAAFSRKAKCDSFADSSTCSGNERDSFLAYFRIHKNT